MPLSPYMQGLIAVLVAFVVNGAIMLGLFVVGEDLIESCAIAVSAVSYGILATRLMMLAVRERAHFFWVCPTLGLTVMAAVVAQLVGVSLVEWPDLFGWNTNWAQAGVGILSMGIGVGFWSGLIGGIVWLAMRRERRVVVGVCGGCGYDLRGSLHARQCPECGRRLVVGVDLPRA